MKLPTGLANQNKKKNMTSKKIITWYLPAVVLDLVHARREKATVATVVENGERTQQIFSIPETF